MGRTRIVWQAWRGMENDAVGSRRSVQDIARQSCDKFTPHTPRTDPCPRTHTQHEHPLPTIPRFVRHEDMQHKRLADPTGRSGGGRVWFFWVKLTSARLNESEHIHIS